MFEINAITLLCTDMIRSVAFYEVLGLEVVYGGPDSDFTSLRLGNNYVNLTVTEGAPAGFWGRVILFVVSPDDVYEAVSGAGYSPLMKPADAPWGERYFHIRDPDGHELSIARKL